MPMNIDDWWHDIRLAARGLWRAKGLAAAAVLMLGAGIAGATAMFAIVEGVLLRPLPVREQSRVLVAWRHVRSGGPGHWPFRVPDLDVIRRESRTLESVAGVSYNGAGPVAVLENGSASYVSMAPVGGGLFDVLGVRPVLGRALTEADDVSGAERVLVITSGLWQRRYGGAAGAIGRTLVVEERPFTIVGVMPPDVEYPRGVEAWLTIAAQSAMLSNPAFRVDVDLIARRRPGVTMEQAASELQALTARLDAAAPADNPRGLELLVRPYEELIVGDVRAAMLALFGAVALVLLIASANVATLLLLRSEARHAELVLRAALGASRARLVRQLLAESAVLALAAGVAGLALSRAALNLLLALAPSALVRADSIRIDIAVIAFSLVAAFASAALAGLAPALSAARTDLASHLRSGGTVGIAGAGRHGRRALVVAQVALAITIVAAAGLLTRTLLRLEGADMGLAADRLVFVRLALPQAIYGDRARHLRFLDEVVAAIEASPAVAAATPINTPPFAGTSGWDATFAAEGQTLDQSLANPQLNLEAVHPNFFATVQVALVRGRAFTTGDRAGAPQVAIVSEDVAARSWPGQDPIGKRVKFGDVNSSSSWRTIVGVASRTRYRELMVPRPTLYLPAEQFIVSAQMLLLRSASTVALAAGAARTAVASVNPTVQVMEVAPFAELLEGPLARPRFNARVIGIFAGAALLLAAIGVYAVMGAFVGQRHTEIGIRVALGATASDVRRLVVGEGLRLAAIGAAIGLGGAVAVARLLRGLLFGIDPLDPWSLAAAVLLLVGVSLVASYLPARRAIGLDPIAVLRGE
jgi:putative ABC transport system permease protein